MAGWAIRGVELPFGDRHDRWWVDEHGVVGQVRIDDAEELPGSHFFSGLAEAHAPPAAAAGPARWGGGGRGVVGQVRIDDAEELPGSYFFSGLVDAHAHPAVASGPAGP